MDAASELRAASWLVDAEQRSTTAILFLGAEEGALGRSRRPGPRPGVRGRVPAGAVPIPRAERLARRRGDRARRAPRDAGDV